MTAAPVLFSQRLPGRSVFASATGVPACFGSKTFVECGLVGVVGILAHHAVDNLRVRADKNAQLFSLHTIQNDLRGLGCAGWRVGDKTSGAFGVHSLDVGVGIFRFVPTHGGDPCADLCDLRGVEAVSIGACLDLQGIVANAC